MESLVPFDLSAIFAYPDESEPLFLYDGFRIHGTRAALDAYVKGAYLLDPFYTACTRRVTPGLYRSRDLAPDAFFEGDYYTSWEVHPCISMESGSLAEEVGFMMNLPGGFMAIYSLMRANHRPPFSHADIAALRLVEPVVRAAITHHWRDLRPAPRPEDKPAWSARGAMMELAFEHFSQGILSPREQMVVQLRPARPFGGVDRAQPRHRRGHGAQSPQEHLCQARDLQPARAVQPVHPVGVALSAFRASAAPRRRHRTASPCPPGGSRGSNGAAGRTGRVPARAGVFRVDVERDFVADDLFVGELADDMAGMAVAEIPAFALRHRGDLGIERGAGDFGMRVEVCLALLEQGAGQAAHRLLARIVAPARRSGRNPPPSLRTRVRDRHRRCRPRRSRDPRARSGRDARCSGRCE